MEKFCPEKLYKEIELSYLNQFKQKLEPKLMKYVLDKELLKRKEVFIKHNINSRELNLKSLRRLRKIAVKSIPRKNLTEDILAEKTSLKLRQQGTKDCRVREDKPLKQMKRLNQVNEIDGINGIKGKQKFLLGSKEFFKSTSSQQKTQKIELDLKADQIAIEKAFASH